MYQACYWRATSSVLSEASAAFLAGGRAWILFFPDTSFPSRCGWQRTGLQFLFLHIWRVVGDAPLFTRHMSAGVILEQMNWP